MRSRTARFLAPLLRPKAPATDEPRYRLTPLGEAQIRADGKTVHGRDPRIVGRPA